MYIMKFANICWPIPRTVLTSSNPKYWDASSVTRTSPTRVSSYTGTPARSQHRLFIYSRGVEPIYYHGPHKFWIIAGGPQITTGFILKFYLYYEGYETNG